VGTPAQNESNRNNSLLSTGPKTAIGKRNSARNSYKNGNRAAKEKLVCDESLAYEMRVRRWSDPTTAEADRAEFLLHDNVAMSFEIERTRRSHLERLRRLFENEDTVDQERVHEMGCRLLHDRTGPTATYGTRKWDSKKDRASWEPEAAGPDRPAELVRKLCSSALGCFWLLEQWDSLKDRLQPSSSSSSGGGFWVPSHKFIACRLLGREPMDMLEDRRVADVFAAAHALYRVGKPFDNLISDVGQAALDTLEARITKVYRDLVKPEETKRARQILIELVDENIAEIERILEEHVENRGNKAKRDKDYHGFDPSREGEAIRRHWLRCRNSMERGMKTYEKLGKRDCDGAGLSGLHQPRGDATALVYPAPTPPGPPLTSGGENGAGLRVGGATGTVAVEDDRAPRDWSRTQVSGAGGTAFEERKATVVEIHPSDILACAGFLPERVAPRGLAEEKVEIATALVYPAATPPSPPLTSGGENGAGGRGAEGTGDGDLRSADGRGRETRAQLEEFEMGRGAEALDDRGSDGVTREGLGVGARDRGSERGAGEYGGTAAGSGDDFIAGGDPDVRSAVRVSRSPGDCPLTPALSRREREVDVLSADLVSRSPGDRPLTPALSRREREVEVDPAAELAGAGPDDLTSAHEGTDGGDITNEANFCDDVRISQNHEIVDVTADSGDGSGLDNLRTKPKATWDCDSAGLSDPTPPRPPLNTVRLKVCYGRGPF
jgi:hypothetical protein